MPLWWEEDMSAASSTSLLEAPRSSTKPRSRRCIRRGGLPEGQTFHVAGRSADGWTIVAVHTSKESWEKFRDNTLIPRGSKGIAGGFTAPPEETGFEIQIDLTA
jgi:hypothetical protein